MAKGIRSKYKKRLRSAKRTHFEEIRGNGNLQSLSDRLANPFYDLRKDHEMPANAFVNPKNPDAVFPQFKKPDILDFRSHKLAEGGYTAQNNFRK
mmetsp:Transcript_34402/g.33607  ORF Transcript_34402/g.33607 Transcript_34402/m.33607 type:complete len:95 (+) Transcript_34402:7-291(+)